jgi:flagellar protein FliJ
MFKFKLAPVLKYREWLEEEKLLAFAERQRVYETERAKAQALRDLRSQYFDALREETAKEDVSITFITFYQAYLFFLARKIEEQDEVVAEARQALAKAHEELIEAKKQKEIMLKLKERANKLYLEEEARVEQLALDDFSTIKYIRSRGGLNQFSN